MRKLDALGRLASLFGSHLFLAVTFALAWLAPDAPLAGKRADSALVMTLEGVALVACVLVGGFAEVAYTAFPLVLFAIVLWLAAVGRAALSWTLVGFVWGIVAAFVEGLRAHRGEFGLARVNPAHPHRRYDRVALLYFGLLPLPFVLWLAGPVRWTIWGAVYFALVAAADSFLRDPIDRIPRAILRRMQSNTSQAILDRIQSNTSPSIAARLGVCRTCLYAQPAAPQREGRDVRCQRSLADDAYPEYPATPLASCRGFVDRERGGA